MAPPRRVLEPAGAPAVTPKLRDVPVAKRYFWKTTLEAQISQSVYDQNAEYTRRRLPCHETLTMALQEIAAQHGRGYFFYLPAKSALTSSAAEERLPHERQLAGAVSPHYPDIIYMDFRWSPEDRAHFQQTSHRNRYLKSGFLTNPPPPSTPLIAMQVIERANVAVNIAAPNSQILLMTQSTSYLINPTELERLFGKRNGAINKPSYIWRSEDVEKGSEVDRQAKRQKLQSLDDFSLGTMEELYTALIGLCRDRPATFMAEGLWRILPRPDWALAASVGSPLGQGESRADAPSRRGEFRVSRRGNSDLPSDI